MIAWPSNLRVYLAAGVTDMRKSIDTLAVLVSERLYLDPLSGHLFGFCNRKRDTIKILYWDRNGFCLCISDWSGIGFSGRTANPKRGCSLPGSWPGCSTACQSNRRHTRLISGLVDWFDRLDDGQQRLVLGLVGLVAAWKLLNLGFLTTPMGMIITGLLGIIALVDDYLTFKENVPDLRNSRVEDIIHELSDYHVDVLVHDPLADTREAREEYGVDLLPLPELRQLDALILAVSHAEFAQLDAARIAAMFKNPASGIVIDVKGFLDRDALSREFRYWRL